jgi:hypothetical protein
MDSSQNKLILLDDQEDIKQLLIYFALFALNFERLVGKIIELSKAITNELSDQDRTGGEWINHLKILFENNQNLNDADKVIWESIRKRLWELNKYRINLLKGEKYYQISLDGKGASFIPYNLKKDFQERQPQTRIYLTEISDHLEKCKHLDFVIENLIECIDKKVNISDVFSEENGKYTVNFRPFYKNQ